MTTETTDTNNIRQHQTLVELHWENVDGRVKVILPGSDIMVLQMDAAVQACRAFHKQVIFGDQLKMLLQGLAEWIHTRVDMLSDAYLTVRDAGLLFVVVRKNRPYDSDFEDNLTDLDVEVANNPDYNLIKMDVLALPNSSDESIKSFVSNTSFTFKFKIHGE